MKICFTCQQPFEPTEAQLARKAKLMKTVPKFEDEARQTAKHRASDEVRIMPEDELWLISQAVEVFREERIPPEWRGSCPYLSSTLRRNDEPTDLTAEQWLERLQHEGKQ